MSKELTEAEMPEVINVRTAVTVEEALNISDARFRELGWIIDEIWAQKPTKAETILALANTKGLTDIERVYIGWKTHEKLASIAAQSIPFVGGLIKKRLR